jgi:hypothetical protein
MTAKAKPLVEGDRVVCKFHDGVVMGYFLSYYNRDYADVALDDEDGEWFSVERRRISKAPANIQIFEATTPPLNKEA